MAPEDPPEDDTSPSSPQAHRRSTVELPNPYLLWIIPVVAVLYVIFVILLATGIIPLFMEVGTAVGLGVVLLLGLLVVLLFLGRTEEVEGVTEDGADEEDAVWSAYGDEPEEPAGEPAFQESVDFTWSWDGHVATLTHPPQDALGDDAIYATTEVTLSDDLELHLQEQVARNPSPYA